MGSDGAISIRRGLDVDLDVLASLNQQMNMEQYSSSNDVGELKARIKELMHSNYEMFLFEVKGKAVGYTLVSKKADPLSILQYYLLPEERGKGYGYSMIGMLMSETHSQGLDVDAPVWRMAAGAM